VYLFYSLSFEHVTQDDRMINDLRGFELDLYDVSSILRPSANIGERTVILSTGRLRINLYREGN